MAASSGARDNSAPRRPCGAGSAAPRRVDRGGGTIAARARGGDGAQGGWRWWSGGGQRCAVRLVVVVVWATACDCSGEPLEERRSTRSGGV